MAYSALAVTGAGSTEAGRAAESLCGPSDGSQNRLTEKGDAVEFKQVPASTLVIYHIVLYPAKRLEPGIHLPNLIILCTVLKVP